MAATVPSAVRNLQRGLRNDGHACAAEIVAANLVPMLGAMSAGDVLSAQQIVDGLPRPAISTIREHEFDVKSPLWFYILREAGLHGNGERLGAPRQSRAHPRPSWR